MEGKKFDEGKLQWHLVPIDVMKQVVRVFMFCKNLYGFDNWKNIKDEKRI